MQKAPVPSDRGRKDAVPPLVRRFLAKTASCRANTRRRDNGRTRHSPTGGLPVQAAAPGCISQPVPSPSHQTGGSLGGTGVGTPPCHRSVILNWIIGYLTGFVKVKIPFPAFLCRDQTALSIKSPPGQNARLPLREKKQRSPRINSTKPSFCVVSYRPPHCPAAPQRPPGWRQ